MKYDERACKFNMDTGCVELLFQDGRKISIDCTGVEDALDVTMAQQTELEGRGQQDASAFQSTKRMLGAATGPVERMRD